MRRCFRQFSYMCITFSHKNPTCWVCSSGQSPSLRQESLRFFSQESVIHSAVLFKQSVSLSKHVNPPTSSVFPRTLAAHTRSSTIERLPLFCIFKSEAYQIKLLGLGRTWQDGEPFCYWLKKWSVKYAGRLSVPSPLNVQSPLHNLILGLY